MGGVLAGVDDHELLVWKRYLLAEAATLTCRLPSGFKPRPDMNFGLTPTPIAGDRRHCGAAACDSSNFGRAVGEKELNMSDPMSAGFPSRRQRPEH